VKDLKSWLDGDWDAVFSIWPLDQPPKHRICSYLLGKAIERSRFKGDLLFYSVHTDLLPNFYVDITNRINQKQDLISNYRSQIKTRKYDHISRGLDAWRSRLIDDSGKAKFIETFMKIPVEAYKDFQEVYEMVNSNELFKANEACIRSFKGLKNMEY
jgi:hypothetical protein